MADDRARVVVIGGGVAGTSIAYHLTRLGWTDVVLLDRGELTSGSTFHSAGLVAQLRNSVSHTRMMMYGAELYPMLAEETGVDPGWHQVGTLHLASSPYRMEALARQAGWAKSFGLPVEIVSTEDALERFPLIDAMATPIGILGGVRGVFFANLGGAGLEGLQFKVWDNNTFVTDPIRNEAGIIIRPGQRIEGFRLHDSRASYGIGLETFALGFPLHFDWSYRTLFNKDWENHLFGSSELWRRGEFSVWMGYDF